MRVKFQIFVSSTYSDMVNERRALTDAILGLNHIPIGMEVLPAASQTPWDLIRRVIDESDYYILVIRGRYGTIDESGIGFTQKEYEYAQTKGIPTLCFLHKNPESLPANQVEQTAIGKRKLKEFRDALENGPFKKHCKYWTNEDDLCRFAIQALFSAFEMHPRPGMVRRDHDNSELYVRIAASAQAEVEKLKAENEELRRQVTGSPSCDARLELSCEIPFEAIRMDGKLKRNGTVEFRLSELLNCLGQLLLTPALPREILHQLQISVARRIVGTEGWEEFGPTMSESSPDSPILRVNINPNAVDIILMRLMACGMAEPILRTQPAPMRHFATLRRMMDAKKYGVSEAPTEEVRAWVLSHEGKARFLHSRFDVGSVGE